MKTNQPETLLTRMRAMERRIAELERGRTLNSASVSQGSFTVRTPDGDVIMRVGEIVVGASTFYGVEMLRRDGSLQARFYDSATGGGYWSMHDEAGTVIMSNDTTSGQGIARPYLDLPFVPWSSVLTPPDLTTSATFATVHRAHGRKQQPWVEFMVVTKLDAGTTGEIRLTQGGVDISGVTSLPDGDYSYRRLTGPVTGDHMADLQIDVQARRVSGAGNVRVLVAHAIGRQS